MKIYFRIPFTWYWIGRVRPMTADTEPSGKVLWCLFTKRWEVDHYYWKALI